MRFPCITSNLISKITDTIDNFYYIPCSHNKSSQPSTTTLHHVTSHLTSSHHHTSPRLSTSHPAPLHHITYRALHITCRMQQHTVRVTHSFHPTLYILGSNNIILQEKPYENRLQHNRSYVWWCGLWMFFHFCYYTAIMAKDKQHNFINDWILWYLRLFILTWCNFKLSSDKNYLTVRRTRCGSWKTSSHCTGDKFKHFSSARFHWEVIKTACVGFEKLPCY